MDITSTAEPSAGLKLLAWLSPAFPVGSFAYSHGLEWAHEAGWISDVDALIAWITDLVEQGSWRSDTILCMSAYNAALNTDLKSLAEVAELAAALAPSAERRLETLQQGNAFVTVIRAAWPCKTIDALKQAAPGDIAYPVALGVAAAGHGIALPILIEAYGCAFVSNLASAAIRLSLIGQTDGQRVVAKLLPIIGRTAQSLHAATLDDLGSVAFRSDLASLLHETQYTRLFRS